MPLIRVSLRRGKPVDYLQALVEEVHLAMRETFNVPENDVFATISQHDEHEFFVDATYLGIERDGDAIIFQIVASNTRGVDMKRALVARLTERLSKRPGVAPRNVFVNIVETQTENWSFGNGVLQYAPEPQL